MKGETTLLAPREATHVLAVRPDDHDGSDGDGAAKQAAQGAEGTGGASTTALNSRVNADSGAAAGATNATHTTGARDTHRTQAIIATPNPGSLAVEVPSAQG